VHLRILKVIATSGFLTALECTKFVFGPGSHWGSSQRSPHPLASLKGTILLREGEGSGKEGKVDEGRGRKGEVRKEGEGPPPLTHIPRSPAG